MPWPTPIQRLPCIILALATAARLAAAESPSIATPPYATNHVLVMFKPAAGANLAHRSTEDALKTLLQRLPLPAGARLEEPAMSQWTRQRRPKPPPLDSLPVDLSRFFYLRLPPGLSVSRCLELLDRHPLLEYAEPDGIGTGGLIIPTDPNFSQQWHHRNLATPGADIQTPAAWEITTGSTNVVVAVLDTGVNATLTEFSNRVVVGFDFVNNDSDPSDDNGHGTAVAGTLAANANNASVGVGVDWQCRIMPVKVLDQGNSGFYSTWAQGIDYAVANGAKVINLSAGGSSTGTSINRSITNAIGRGVIFVTITHNFATNIITYPGNIVEAITVGATTDEDQHASFSNYGPEIDLVAPGDAIRTVSRFGALSTWTGTSFSAPQVAGTCALMAAFRPDLNQSLALRFLTESAQDQVGGALDTPGFDIYFGHGRLNAHRALLAALTNSTDLRLTLAASALTIPVGCPATFSLTLSNLGPSTATGVLLTNLIPSNSQWIRTESSQGSYDSIPNGFVFNFGSIPPQSSATAQVTVLATQPGTLTNAAALSLDTIDYRPDNNQAILYLTAYVDSGSPPRLLAASVEPTGSSFKLTFSKVLDPATALDPTHFQLTDGPTNLLPITNLRFGAQQHLVLGDAPFLGNHSPFTLTVQSLADCLGQSMAAPTQVNLTLPTLQLVPLGSTWRYHDQGQELSTAWRSPTYNDEAWPSGPAQFGYGEGDEATVVGYGADRDAKFITTYFRHEFLVPNPSTVTNLIFRLLRDDGAAVYLNGTEIYRNNLPSTSLNSYTLALSNIDTPDEGTFLTFNLSSNLLVAGVNLLAVEIHQATPSSTDISFDLELTATIRPFTLPPVFLTQPESQFAFVGDKVTFNVQVGGTLPIGYRWRRGSLIIVPVNQGTPTLTLTNVQLTNSGNYNVIVTNPAVFTGVFSATGRLDVFLDADMDRMADVWESAYNLDPGTSMDADLDDDHDDFSNLDEFNAGTSPIDPTSYLRIDRLSSSTNGAVIEFEAVSNRSYSVLVSQPLATGPWQLLSNTPGYVTNRLVRILDPTPQTQPRYYRLATPKWSGP